MPTSFCTGLLAFLLACAHAAAQPAPERVAAAQLPGAASAPAIAAAAFLLVDVTSGQPIVAANPDARREPASLTKLMTAYLAFAALRDGKLAPTQAVPVSQAAWRAEGSRMFIEPRRAVSVDELLRGLIVQSGNDAAIALAEAIAGSESAFALRMNEQAKTLGLADTHFVNATGLSDPAHYSTATDIARIAAAIIVDFPDRFPLYSIREFAYNNITQPNRNRLLWMDPTVDGMKTGRTDAAGFCLVATAKRGPRRMLAVVLGANSDLARAGEAQKLLNYGFQSFDTVGLYASGKAVSSLRVWKGDAAEVGAGFLVDTYVTLPHGAAGRIASTLAATEPLVAPVVRGAALGTLRVTLDGKPVASLPVVALADVRPGNVFSRAFDTVRLWFR